MACTAHRLSDTGYSDAELLRGAIGALRRLGNHDPVVAFHVDSELTTADLALLGATSLAPVRVADALHVASDETWRALNGSSIRFFRSYYCTIFALLHSPFVRTTVMSPDTLFVRNPSHWWLHEPKLRVTGTLFFHDFFVAESEDPWFTRRPCDLITSLATDGSLPPALRGRLRNTWRSPYWRSGAHSRGNGYALFCERSTYHNLESSLVLVDASKPGGQGTLAGLVALLPRIVADRSIRGLSHGDTEFFWIACELAGGPCAFSGELPALLHRDAPSSAARLHNHRRGCHAHLTPHGAAHGAGHPALAISHVNLDSYCGWETLEPPDAIRRAAQTYDAVDVPAVGRNLSHAEWRALNRFREDILRHKRSLLAPWHPRHCHRASAGKVCADACSEDARPDNAEDVRLGDAPRHAPSAECAALVAARSEFCMAGYLRDKASALMRDNALFHPFDAAFCIDASWRSASRASRPSHENSGELTNAAFHRVGKSLASCLTALGWGGGPADWAAQRAAMADRPHDYHEHERNTVISHLAGFEGRTIWSLQAHSDAQIVALCRKAHGQGWV